MPIPQRVRDFLNSQGTRYDVLHHSQAFTGQETAHSLHISGKRLAKAVVLNADGKLIMAIMLASHRLSLPDLRAMLEVKHLTMLAEDELAKLMPDCDLGAVPPFGNLYGAEVWVDREVSNAEEIVFCAGTHEDCIRMTYSDFAHLTKPRLGRFAEVWADKVA